jgi:hypothetical protein
MKKRYAKMMLRVSAPLALLLIVTGCNKLVDIPAPRYVLNTQDVFADSTTTMSAVSALYGSMLTGSNFSYNGQQYALSSLYADETTNITYPEYQNNALTPSDLLVRALWVDSYKFVYLANSVIEQAGASATISAGVKNRAIGEAKFIRAFCYFQLINFYGPVPLVLTTNLAASRELPASSYAVAAQQVIAVLVDAQRRSPADYAISANLRVRANKYAASALLAKMYLYLKDWNNAEIQATAVISKTDVFSLESNLSKVFLNSSPEAILQFSNREIGFAGIASYFVPRAGFQPPYVISSALLSAFEADDARKTNWIASSAGLAYPAKYKVTTGATEMDILLRLSDILLVRAEARAKLNNSSGAQQDLNLVRRRAGLPNTTAALVPDLLAAIEKERRVELFCEWNNRFFDLKRTGRIDAVMSAAKPNVWRPIASLYPIPLTEIAANPKLIQNTGY